jgi:hypothetical protein
LERHVPVPPPRNGFLARRPDLVISPIVDIRHCMSDIETAAVDGLKVLDRGRQRSWLAF